MEWVYDNDFDSFSLKVGEYLVSRDILLADITEAIFMVKANPSDADSAAKATLTLGNGLTVVAGATELDGVISAKFNTSNFGLSSMMLGENYYVGLGIKLATLTKFLEIKPVDNRLSLTGDFIHD
tara:strand:+ start:373 stop:747 length:375 start_codon:yes stop_codon:yes gene_type:complete